MHRNLLRSATLLLALLSALGALTTRAAAHEEGDGLLTAGPRFIALLDSGQVVADTPSTSNASGMAFLTLSPMESELCWTLTFSGLEGTQLAAPSGAHIHGPARPGRSNHNHVAELASGSPLNACEVLTRDEVKWLKTGELYFQIHSDAFPAGEIRGQIVRLK